MSKIGVVVSNVGTPRSPDAKGLKAYLKQFLMDPFVIQMPWIIRFILVYVIIAPLRSKKSAKNYQKIWTKKGSPLLVETQKMAESLQSHLGEDFKVVVAMRYGSPSFSDAHKELSECEQIISFPQYPQYAESTNETGLVEFKKYFSDKKNSLIEPYFENPLFISAYVEYLKDKIKDKKNHLLMSFHGLPEAHIKKIVASNSYCLKVKSCCDYPEAKVLKFCYRAQCYRSARLIAQGLNLTEKDYTVSFQSRVGKQKWIGPSTEETYGTLVQKGIRKVQVICPGFSVDGLETLEEIAISGKERFLSLGGESFEFVPCLNSDSRWIEACAKMVKNIIS